MKYALCAATVHAIGLQNVSSGGEDAKNNAKAAAWQASLPWIVLHYFETVWPRQIVSFLSLEVNQTHRVLPLCTRYGWLSKTSGLQSLPER